MGVKIEHRYDSEAKIFYKYFYGDIIFNDIITDWLLLIQKKQLPSGVKRFILDYRKAKLLATAGSAKDIASFYKKHALWFQQSKVALIMQNPDEVIIPILANEECAGLLEFRPFYTLDGALEWVIK